MEEILIYITYIGCIEHEHTKTIDEESKDKGGENAQ